MVRFKSPSVYSCGAFLYLNVNRQKKPVLSIVDVSWLAQAACPVFGVPPVPLVPVPVGLVPAPAPDMNRAYGTHFLYVRLVPCDESQGYNIGRAYRHLWVSTGIKVWRRTLKKMWFITPKALLSVIVFVQFLIMGVNQNPPCG